MLKVLLSKEVIYPILIICFSILICGAFKRVTKNIITKKMIIGDEKKVKTLLVLFNNIIKYTIVVIAILMILDIYKIDTKTIVASIGAIGVVIGLSLQDTLKDLFAGMFILFENQYRIGDVVTIGTFKGEVISLGMKTTKLKSLSGDIKMISNRFITEVVNHSLQDSVAIVDVAVSYECDLLLAERVLKTSCKELGKQLKDLKSEIEVLGIEDLAEDGIIFRIRAYCLPLTQYEIQRQIRKKIKMDLEFNNISIPYRQLVVHSE